jgi:hypothetical protein
MPLTPLPAALVCRACFVVRGHNRWQLASGKVSDLRLYVYFEGGPGRAIGRAALRKIHCGDTQKRCPAGGGAIPPKMLSPLLPVEVCTVAERDVPEVALSPTFHCNNIGPGATALLGFVSWVFDVTGEHETGGAVSESI